MRLRKRARHQDAPEGVRLVFPGGQVVPCGVLRDPDGDKRGCAMWVAVPLEPLPSDGDGMHLTARRLPARSILSLRVTLPRRPLA